MNVLNVHQSATAELVRAGRVSRKDRAAALESVIPLAGGKFIVEHWRNGKRINEYHFKNGITTEGKNALLDIMFDGGTQITAWYLGLIDNTGFTALADGDTYDDINQAGNGWDEFDDYTDPSNADSALTRPQWSPDAASAASITNSTVRQFDITASGTIKGVFVAGGGAAPETKGDHASGSTLWATALFSGGDVPVQNGDALKVTYSVSA